MYHVCVACNRSKFSFKRPLFQSIRGWCGKCIKAIIKEKNVMDKWGGLRLQRIVIWLCIFFFCSGISFAASLKETQRATRRNTTMYENLKDLRRQEYKQLRIRRNLIEDIKDDILDKHKEKQKKRH